MAKKLLFLSSFVIFLSFLFPLSVLGIGQLTEPILLENVLRGQEITEPVYLFNTEDKEAVFVLAAEGEIAGWASFYSLEDENLENPLEKIKIPGRESIKVLVKFVIPQDIPNGEYAGFVSVASEAADEGGKREGLTTLVREKVGREVLITVTDQEIINFETTIIPEKYGLKKGEPLKIKAIYDNRGNIAIRPNLQLKILKGEQTVFKAIFPYPEDETAVRPFERRTLPALVEWSSAGQARGSYRAEVKVLLNDQVYHEEDFQFSVGLVGLNDFLQAVAGLGRGSLILGWFIIGTFFVVLAGILTIYYRRSRLRARD